MKMESKSKLMNQKIYNNFKMSRILTEEIIPNTIEFCSMNVFKYLLKTITMQCNVMMVKLY